MQTRTLFGSLFFVFACLSLSVVAPASRAAAQELALEDTYEPGVRFELAGRLGLGWSWYDVAAEHDVPALGESSGLLHLGGMFAVRDAVTGLGVSVGYAHTFQGTLDEHYGIHALEVRLTELVPLYVNDRFRIGLLAELGGVYAVGGGWEKGCHTFSGFCDTSDRQVDVELAGGLGALGLQFVFNRFLLAVEVDYRVTCSLSGPLELQQDVMPLARLGVTFDS